MSDYQDGTLDERDDDDLHLDDEHDADGGDDGSEQGERQEHEADDDRRQEGEDDEDRRRARAEDRRERRERQRLARERSERQIRELTATVQQLQAQLGTIDHRTATGQIETGIAQAQTAYQQAQKALRDAVEAGDVDRQVELMEGVAVARRRVEDLAALKERANQPRQQPAPPNDAAIRTKAYYDGFVAQNQWFDPTGRDADSRDAIAISNQVAAAGIPAHDPRHWTEIDRRLREKMPHRFGRASDERRAPRQPTGGVGRSTQQGGGPSKGWATPERRQALSEMGLSESDPQAKPYIEAWKNYDKSAAGAR